MAVINILKDGTVIEDLTGYKVTREMLPGLYAVLDQINKRRSEHEEAQKETTKEKGGRYAANF